MTFKQHFNIPDDIIYLNTPGNGLIPNPTLKWRTQWDQQFFDVKSDIRDKQPEILAQIKGNIANSFQAKNEQTFLTPNFSFAYNVLIDLLPKNFKYLILEDEYPSLQYPLTNRRLNQQNIPPSINMEEEIALAVNRLQPDVLVLSIVQYISGMKIDLEFIKKLKQEHPKLLILADATQYIGTEPFSFKESGIDALATSGYKWLMGGFGNGFICLSDQLTDLLQDLCQDIPKPKAAMWQYKSILSTLFEPGHQDTLAHGTLSKSIDFLNSIGLKQIEQKLIETKTEAYHLLEERGWLLPITQRKIKSSVINIQINPALYPNLVQSGVKCFPRGSGIRIGLHLYNDVQDVHRLIEILESIK